MKLYFVRHGESEANILRVISNRGSQHPLTEKGREQAHTLTAKLADANIRHIYVSPLLRAVQTADILAAAWNALVSIDDGLREYDCGVMEGRSDDEAWAQHALGLQKWLVEEDYSFRIKDGESFYDIQERFVPLIDSLIDRYAYQDVGLALVGHGGLYRCMLPLVLANIDRAFVGEKWLGNTEFVLAEWRQERLICLEWCGQTPPDAG